MKRAPENCANCSTSAQRVEPDMTSENENTNENKRPSQLKKLIEKGREQGQWLTYAQVNDHLPGDIVDPEQIEDIVNMINDMSIKMLEEETVDADTVSLNDSDRQSDV